MATKYDFIEEYVAECLTAYEYYVERHMSLRQCADEMLLSFNTVQNRLKSLKAIDPERYERYRKIAERRNKHK